MNIQKWGVRKSFCHLVKYPPAPYPALIMTGPQVRSFIVLLPHITQNKSTWPSQAFMNIPVSREGRKKTLHNNVLVY